MPADPHLQRIVAAICTARGLVLGPEVGAGAFKHTFEVRTADSRRLAFKIYKRVGADARTQREVDAITRCAHPGVVRFELVDTWKDGAEEYVYSLEEFLAGGTLTARISAGLMPAAELRVLAVQLVQAVAHIASLDLVHRDLKPDNIMFNAPGGAPVIVDFGLVRDLSQLSLTKTWQPQGPGTPYFSAPEQLNNQKHLIDWRSDQFALGVVLSIAGFGHHPYALAGGDPYGTVDRVAAREPISPEFEKWARGAALQPIAKMVSGWPVQRYRTPAMLAAAWAKAGGA